MITDKIENLNHYGVVSKDYEEQILSFIQRVQAENLSDGKYLIDDNDLFALVQSYETREKETSKMEAHRKYIDLQYMVNGREEMYCDFTKNLVVTEAYNKDSDIFFMEMEKERVSILLEEGMFVFLFPWDAHMPCCKAEEKEAVKKIVFKIKN